MDQIAKITECPRDAMQGWERPISTSTKVDYLKALFAVGFDVLDMGSFVSPKAIPQMADTEEVLQALQGIETTSDLLCIVANERGMERAAQQSLVDIVGYPFSISETFQLRNTNATIAQSLTRLDAIHEMARSAKKELVVYLSMGFGNPYGDTWSPALVLQWVEQIMERYSPSTISLSDTTGSADSALTAEIFDVVKTKFPDAPLGVHLHSLPQDVASKAVAAYKAGCRHFEGAINGIGGCPMAADELTGNMDSGLMLTALDEHKAVPQINWAAFEKASKLAGSVFV